MPDQKLTVGLTDARRGAEVIEKLAYSVDDVAELLSIGRTKVVAMVSSGEIPSIKLGGRRLIPQQDLHGFIERLRIASFEEAS